MANKINVTQSKLFKEVANVIGGYEALQQLAMAYRNYDVQYSGKYIMQFDVTKPLMDAFAWEYTPQGFDYWEDIHNKSRYFLK